MIITRKLVSDNNWDSKDGPSIFAVFTQSDKGILDLVYKEKLASLWEFSSGISKDELYKILAATQETCVSKLQGGYVLFAKDAQFKHEETEVERDIIRGLK